MELERLKAAVSRFKGLLYCYDTVLQDKALLLDVLAFYR